MSDMSERSCKTIQMWYLTYRHDPAAIGTIEFITLSCLKLTKNNNCHLCGISAELIYRYIMIQSVIRVHDLC